MIEQIGRYKILSELGRGAMGVVYKAQDPTIGRLVAIKTIRLGEVAQPEEREQLRSRLFREAQSAGILSHPGIVTIYDIAEESNLAYITMEFVEGQTLEKMLDQGLVDDARYVVSIANQTALALDYAHSKGIIHRDIKPGNIMVNGEGQVKITDFGIARIASSKFTHTGTVMGTPSYMSPEQVRGATVDGRSDLFSLSVVLYEMLTGQKPFTGDSITSVIFKIVSENPVPPRELNPSVGTKVNAVVMRALAKEPAERYQTCKEFAESLQLAAAQTAKLTPTVRKLALQEVSEALRVTQPDKPAAAAAETPPAQVAPPAEAAPAPAETVVEKKLPPLEPRPDARPNASTAAPVIVEQRPRRTGWVIALVVVVGAIAGGLLFQMRFQVREKIQLLRSSAPPLVTAPALPAPKLEPAAVAPAGSPAEAAAVHPEQTAPPPEEKQAPATPAAPAPTASSPAAPSPAGPASLVIHVVTAQPGARVVADGQELTACLTPCDIPVRRGRHNLLLVQPGHHTESREVTITNESQEVRVAMRPMTGTLWLTSDPPGASITVDGKPVEGLTPKTLTLPVGKHLIAVSKPGAGSAEQEVELVAESSVTVRVNLQQR